MWELSAPQLTAQNGKVRVACNIKNGAETRELWFETEAEHQAAIATDVCDAFLIALLVPAMLQGQDIAVRGALSSKLYYNITHLLLASLQAYLPDAKLIKVTADRLISNFAQRGTAVLSGFSGGVDSFCNYYDHTGDRSPPEFLITHFVYNNVGSHGQMGAEQDQETFRNHAAAMQKFAAEEGKPLITVNSNLDAIMGLDFQLTHTIRNVTVPLLLQNIAAKFLYPSCSHIRFTEVKPSFDIAGLDAIILPLLSTERLDCITSGAQYERTGKAVNVAAMPASYHYLDVCVEPYLAKPGQTNCARCWKCMRTQMTFEAIGKLEHYRDVFDLNEYRLYKNLFLVDVLKSKNNHQEDLAAFIKQHNYPIPRGVRLVAALTPQYVGHRIAKRIMPRLRNKTWLLKIFNKLTSM